VIEPKTSMLTMYEPEDVGKVKDMYFKYKSELSKMMKDFYDGAKKEGEFDSMFDDRIQKKFQQEIGNYTVYGKDGKEKYNYGMHGGMRNLYD
jgi:hypothetical protein